MLRSSPVLNGPLLEFRGYTAKVPLLLTKNCGKEGQNRVKKDFTMSELLCGGVKRQSLKAR